MTLLTVVQDAMVEVGMPRPSAAVSSTDPGIIAMINFVNQSGRELMRRHEWQAIATEKTFTTIAQASQTSAIPADFDRFINGTFWNRTKDRPVHGPISAQEWQQRQASSIGGITDFFRVRGDAILIDPVPTAGETMAFEYVSTYWVDSSKTAATADADTFALDENLIKLGAIWRFLKSRGMDYAEAFRDAEEQVMNLIARDGGRGVLSFSKPQTRKPMAPYAAEGSWSL